MPSENPITEFNDLRRIALEQNGQLSDDQLRQAIELAIESRAKSGKKTKAHSEQAGEEALAKLGEQLKGLGSSK